jgi:hypothetical protein
MTNKKMDTAGRLRALRRRIAVDQMNKPVGGELYKILLRWRDELEVEALDKEMLELKNRIMKFLNQPN